MEFKHILFPMDFSERCHRISPDVRDAVKRFGSELTLLHVIDFPGYHWYSEGGYFPEAVPPEVMAQAEKMMHDFVNAEFRGLSVKTVVQQGNPGLCVADACEAGVDLVMMPTHGRGPFRAMLLGSVAGQVLHDTSCPVWTAAHADSETMARRTHWKNIVCAIDAEPHSLEIVRFAAGLAEKCGSEVHLLHAIPAAAAGLEACYDVEFDTFLSNVAKDAIGEMQKQAGTNFAVEIRQRGVSGAVADAVREFDADLVLTGRGTVTKFAGGVRSSAFAIIRDAGCPVLTV